MSSLKSFLHKSYPGLSTAAGGLVLLYCGEDMATKLLEHIGHDAVEVFVATGVRWFYASLAFLGLAAGFRPFYKMVDRVTDFNTDLQIERQNKAASMIPAAAVLGYMIAGGMIMAAVARVAG